jgi:hypothetical protein
MDHLVFAHVGCFAIFVPATQQCLIDAGGQGDEAFFCAHVFIGDPAKVRKSPRGDISIKIS